MNKQEFGTLIKGVKAYFPNFILDRLQMDLWFDSLNDLEYSTTQKAIKKLAQTTEYAPTIAAIRKSYVSIDSPPIASSEEVLLLIGKVVSKFGRYQLVEGLEWLKEQNETAWRVLKAIGYNNYCNADPNFSSNLIVRMTNEIAKSEGEQLLLERQFASDIKKIQGQSLLMMADIEKW